uniref:helix-turn-helix domain-containing protein n=1 Tax=Dysgonomonas gadei TaxID=156974 RepID=UPI003AF15082
KEKGIRVGDFADVLGMKQSNLSNIINSKANPSIDMLQRIADQLNVNIKDLFEGDSITGFIKVNGIAHEINSVEDIERILQKIKAG